MDGHNGETAALVEGVTDAIYTHVQRVGDGVLTYEACGGIAAAVVADLGIERVGWLGRSGVCDRYHSPDAHHYACVPIFKTFRKFGHNGGSVTP